MATCQPCRNNFWLCSKKYEVLRFKFDFLRNLKLPAQHFFTELCMFLDFISLRKNLFFSEQVRKSKTRNSLKFWLSNKCLTLKMCKTLIKIFCWWGWYWCNDLICSLSDESSGNLAWSTCWMSVVQLSYRRNVQYLDVCQLDATDRIGSTVHNDFNRFG